MCGRYVLSLRPSVVRQRLEQLDMPADDGPDDSDERLRQTYNFAPGYHGLIYRAQIPERSLATHDMPENTNEEHSAKRVKVSHSGSAAGHEFDVHTATKTKYKIQAAKWGLIPFWTKRAPDYGSQMRTINCRDDSLAQPGGMWNSMKQRKRCIVVAEGFYEWLKKNGGKDKIPHFVKRKDGALMCFAGLWDMVQYEGSSDKLYTYTIVTTDSNKQLKFLHDRMPVIVEPGSDQMKLWLDPDRVGWDKDLQQMLHPFDGELECYPVDKAVGKVGNNSAQFVIPVDSKDNKKNIANFFGNQAKLASPAKQANKPDLEMVKDEEVTVIDTKNEVSENNAPLPKPHSKHTEFTETTIKHEAVSEKDLVNPQAQHDQNQHDDSRVDADTNLGGAENDSFQRSPPTTPRSTSKKKPGIGSKRGRDPTSNDTTAKTPRKEGNTKITSFFGK